jgi:hypothetical protein
MKLTWSAGALAGLTQNGGGWSARPPAAHASPEATRSLLQTSRFTKMPAGAPALRIAPGVRA